MTQVPQTATGAHNPDFELAMKRLHGEIRAAIGDREDADDIAERVMQTVRPGYSGLWSSCEYHADVAVSWQKEAERAGLVNQQLRELDALVFTSGLSSVLADDGNAVDRIATGLKLAASVLTPGCGQLDWCNACYRHVPHGRLHPVPDAPDGGAPLPRDWRAVDVASGTAYVDEPAETVPQGAYVSGGFTSDPEDGANFILRVEQAAGSGDDDLSHMDLAQAVADRLNGGTR